MKIRLVLLIVLVVVSLHALSQQDSVYRLFLKNGSFVPQKNINPDFTQEFNRRILRIEGRSFAIIQFEHIPTAGERQQLLNAGISLLDYIPNNTYTVSIRGSINDKTLKQAGARSVIELKPEQKMAQPLAWGVAPPWSVKVPGTVDVWIMFLKILSPGSVLEELHQKNFDILSSDYQDYHIISLRVPLQRLNELASLPFIEYVQPAPHEDQPLNNVDRADARANLLNAPVAFGGRNLRGEGIVIGIGDDANPSVHVDFTNRIINRTYAPPSGQHGQHVTGTAAGAGILNELYKGYAPKATIITQYFSGIWLNAASYIQDYGMVVTNNSYGAVTGDCSYSGLYDLYSAMLDQQAFDFPYLQHVFASGNDGLLSCPPYPPGFKTVLGSYQSAKNVLSVGATDSAGLIADFSSKGPVKDGRIKPEISAMGKRVVSAGFGSYWYNNGTSMASPGVAGGLTLLYQLYKQINGGNPKSGLMKAIVCNSSRDMGSTGPDFSYGFGWLDLQRAALTIENNRYFTSGIANAIQNTHSITIPANAAQLKVMLYWHDPPASLLSSQTLVNDLDLTVQTPASLTVLPRILDTIPSHVTDTSTLGPDHINNIEQVIINNPLAGTYTIKVNGNSVTQNSPQEYFVVYDIVPDSTKLSFPIGGESFLTTDSVLIQWDAFGSGATFTLNYSTDNGVNWITIDNNIAGNQRQKKWKVPNIVTDKAKIQLINNTTGVLSTGNAFTILGLPVISLDPVQCEGYIKIKWASIPNATDYEVFMLRGDDMQSMATTTALNYTFSGLSKDSTYWVAVRARLNGSPGRRSVAISRNPNTGTCAGNISDNDLKLDSLLQPITGRKFTSSELSSSVHIQARVKNLDNVAISNFDIKYSVNGGAWFSENIPGPLNAGATITQTFATTYDFSAVGTYTIKAVVYYASDPVRTNDTLTVVVKQLDNQPIDLTSPFVENFDGAPQQEFLTAQTGLTTLDRFDFTNTSVNGRLRSFINTGIANSGDKAITLDVDRYIYPSVNTNLLYGTFNLSNYNASADDIRLDFYYNNHGQPAGSNNQVWIRGSETSPWVSAYDLFANQNDPGIYKQTSSIELSDLLANAGQNFTSSCQIRWGQIGFLPATDRANAGGYTFDDIHLYKAVNDIQMLSIDTPIVSSCGLTGATPIKISVRNSVNTAITNIPVKFRVDGGPSVTAETISSINSNTTIQYTFTATANLASLGAHTIEVWVDYPTDNYRHNDTTVTHIVNSTVISSFPYLENFEAGSSSWYTGGIKTSWEYGTPASNKINSAASGSKAWKTKLVGNYNDLEYSYLYSPCFDISSMTNPTLSFSVALDLEDCGTSLCDGAWVEYSTDGVTWNKLGAFGSGTNWYSKNYAGNQLWNIQNYTRWHVATTTLPTGLSRLRVRFVLNSDPAVNREGVAVDDIHIYDNTMGIYDGVTMISPVAQTISGGTSWVDFTSSGKLVASIQPGGQNMGSTSVQTFINSGTVRHTSNQYYHDRNITVIPANSLTDSVAVRFYFLDSETESLLNATGCPVCSKPPSAYELGVSKYSDPTNRTNEDGTISNDALGIWTFINSSKVAKIPFDKGYYAEFKVRDFSEFWLNNGGIFGAIPLPVKLISFTANKQGNNDVLLEWKTAEESDIDRYEIEVAGTTSDYQSNHFEKIGSVKSRGNAGSMQDYNFTDAENNKIGVRYYRLKIIAEDGSFHYSDIRPVIFDDDILWQVYPNPSPGTFYFIFRQNSGETITIKVYNMKGQVVHQEKTIATGFVQKLIIDMQQSKFTRGMYMVVAEGTVTKTFKVVKQ